MKFQIIKGGKDKSSPLEYCFANLDKKEEDLSSRNVEKIEKYAPYIDEAIKELLDNTLRSGFYEGVKSSREAIVDLYLACPESFHAIVEYERNKRES